MSRAWQDELRLLWRDGIVVLSLVAVLISLTLAAISGQAFKETLHRFSSDGLAERAGGCRCGFGDGPVWWAA